MLEEFESKLAATGDMQKTQQGLKVELEAIQKDFFAAKEERDHLVKASAPEAVSQNRANGLERLVSELKSLSAKRLQEIEERDNSIQKLVEERNAARLLAEERELKIVQRDTRLARMTELETAANPIEQLCAERLQEIEILEGRLSRLRGMEEEWARSQVLSDRRQQEIKQLLERLAHFDSLQGEVKLMREVAENYRRDLDARDQRLSQLEDLPEQNAVLRQTLASGHHELVAARRLLAMLEGQLQTVQKQSALLEEHVALKSDQLAGVLTETHEAALALDVPPPVDRDVARTIRQIRELAARTRADAAKLAAELDARKSEIDSLRQRVQEITNLAEARRKRLEAADAKLVPLASTHAEAVQRSQSMATLLERRTAEVRALVMLARGVEYAMEQTKAQWWWQLGLHIRKPFVALGLRSRTPRFPYNSVPELMRKIESFLNKSYPLPPAEPAPVRLTPQPRKEGATGSTGSGAMAAPPALTGLPLVSVISSVHNKEASLLPFVQAYLAQNYNGPIEIVFVNDFSADSSVEQIETLQKYVRQKSDKLTIRLIHTTHNAGNCGARNLGIQRSEGQILIVKDSDCIVNPSFVQAHWRAHELHKAPLCIGPMGIESNGRDIAQLHARLEHDDEALEKEMRLQFPAERTAFVNCVTRNFSITRAFVAEHPMLVPLFDEDFSYSKRPESGFGWEDIEMGYRCYLLGARVFFARDAISVHLTHPPMIDDSDKPQRSMRNFRRLFDKHPQMIYIVPDWADDTFGKIKAWLARYNYQDNPDALAVERLLQETTRTVPLRRSLA